MFSESAGSTGNGNQQAFWGQFVGLIPEAVRCRLLFNIMSAALARAAEYRRESGSFLDAIVNTHLPRAIRRLNRLKREAETLATFYEEDDGLVWQNEDRLKEISKFLSKFEEKIVDELDKAATQTDESIARNIFQSVKKTAKEIARGTKTSFKNASDELEQNVARSLIVKTSLKGFVSCVSLDLAQYGYHSKVLHNLVDAPGVFALNRKIQNEINSAIIEQDIPKEEVVVIDTGDGAIVVFTDNEPDGKTEVANRAYKFSNAFLKSIAEGNKQVDLEHELHFRVGVCSGIIVMERSQIRSGEITQCNTGGVPLGKAVRLQSAARTGEIVICATTWGSLPAEIRSLFSEETPILGKAHEKTPIPAHRWECVAPQSEERPVQ